MRVKCKKCDREFSDRPNDYPGRVYIHHGAVMCEDCRLDMGAMPDSADPATTYLYTRAGMYRVV